MPSVVPVTAICTTVMVITAGVVDMSKKSSMRISMVGHGPDITARLLDGVLADDLFPCGRKTTLAPICDALQRPLRKRALIVEN